ncbi:protein serine/threonine kinase, putative, partial [Entamoeba invadens IP1]|uniref:protein serine/threonine kinase, putative n=1 Tax=Entamoeba invadens IP1 TaxID=370355 RepID=UPI0002C3F96F
LFCEKCSTIDEKCTTCSSTDISPHCDSCENGYWVEENKCVTCEGCGSLGCEYMSGLCYNCPNQIQVLMLGKCVTVEGCKVVENNECVVCDDLYVKIGKSCIKTQTETTENVIKFRKFYVSSIDVNCTTFTTKGCDICEEGYYHYEKISCHECTFINGCSECINYLTNNETSTKECTKCMDMFINNAGECVKIAKCLQGVGERCTLCEKNYLVSEGRCKPCGDVVIGCKTSTKNECTSCIEGHYIDSNKQCSKCLVDNCFVCAQDGTCNTCVTNTTKNTDSTKCFSCSIFNGCTLCDNTTPNKCLLCAQNYFKKNYLCVSCSSLNKCISCSDELTCLHCVDGYYPDDGKCKSCLAINGCKTCSSTSKKCHACKDGYYLDNECKLCGDVFSKSATCTMKKVFSCQPHYFLKNNRCVGCDALFGCSECENETMCTKCTDGLNLYNNGTTQMCSQDCDITKCVKCDINGMCEMCEEPYTLDKMTNKCNLCFDEHQNSGKCSTTENTIEVCESKRFYLEDGVCQKCNTTLSECQLCDNSTTCILCSTGFVLDVNNKCVAKTTSMSIKKATNCESNRQILDTEGNCVDILADEFKVSESFSMKCFNLFYGCYSRDYKLNSTIDVDNLECSACQSGMAFESRETKKCVTTTNLIDSEGYKIECTTGCSTCTNGTNCQYTKSFEFTARSDAKLSYENHKYCQKYQEGFGCVECSNSINLNGICSNMERTQKCSFYLESDNTYKCEGYIEPSQTKTRATLKTENVVCEVLSNGLCIKCYSKYFLNKEYPPKCESCSNNCLTCTTPTTCQVCSNGFSLVNGSCVSLSNCLVSTPSGCTVCNEGYYLLLGSCKMLSEIHCKSIVITINNEVQCTLCVENYILSETQCVDMSTAHCQSVDLSTSKCAICEEKYKFDDNKNVFQWKRRNAHIHHQAIASILNCSKNAGSCVTCAFGYYFDTTSNDCIYVGELAEKCKLFLPSGVDCATCNEGYILINTDCVKCDEKCLSCVGNISNCVKCNVKGGYYEDVEFTTIEDKKCVTITTLENCEWVSEYGCAVCYDGYYQNKYYKCSKCNDLCATCTNNNTCSTCVDQYVLISKTSQCVKWNSIVNCKSYDSKTQKCSECNGSNKVGPNGDECVHKTNVLSIILPIIFCILMVVIIIITISCILFYIHYRKEEKLKKSLVNEFLLKDLKKKGVEMVYLGTQKERILCSTQEIHFENEIAVQKDSDCKFMIGNDRASLLKIQFITQNDEEKFELNVGPSIPVCIKKGRAVEFTVTVHPLCTLEKTVDITCSVLNINKGKISEIKIPVKFASEMSTALDPDELKKERKLGEGSFGIVYKGTYRGNVVAIKEMKEMVVAKLGAKGFTMNSTVESSSRNLTKNATKNIPKNNTTNNSSMTTRDKTAAEKQMDKKMDEFRKEVAMLAKFVSPYVIRFYGACFIPNRICMVTELAKYGSLQDLMKHKKSDEVIMKMRIKLMLDTAKGIQYLHANNTLHRDIKSDNTLVTSLDFNDEVNGK